ncbi:MAG TPA: hypothetical protein VEH08_05270 [Methanomassiliicoccales archaeon]|nr:hypothetical protein [Methanomassiliicoccales archaeon]
MPKPFVVERAGLLSTLILALSLVMIAVGLADVTVGGLGLGGWGGPMLVVGLLIFVVGLYLLVSYLKMISEIKDLMSIDSKAAFIKELDEAGYLAWRLPQKYEDELAERKKRFGLK